MSPSNSLSSSSALARPKRTVGASAGRRLLTAAVALLALVAVACTPTDSEDTSTAPAEAATSAPEPTEESEAAVEEPEDDAAMEEDGAEADEVEEDGAMEEEAPAEEAAPVLEATWRGVTETEIHIGISMLDFAAMASMNLVDSGWGDQVLVWDTYIDDLNARGGIHGRTIVPYYAFYNPIMNVEAVDACVKLTEDVETFAVLGGFLGPSAVSSVNPCITGTNNTILINGVMTEERLAQSTAPWIQAGPLGNRSIDQFLLLLNDEGMLADRKIAIVGSLEAPEAFEAAPGILASYGVEPVVIIENDVGQGDVQGSNDAWAVYAERIRAAGADTVLIVGSGQAALRGTVDNGLDVERWVVNDEDLSNLGSTTPKTSADGAITVTGLTDQERWEDPIATECREVFVAANPEVEIKAPNDVGEGEESWFNPIISYCSWLGIFETLALEAGPDLTHDSFWAAIESVPDFSVSGMPFASLGDGKFDANDSIRLGIFDADASASGDIVALTDIRDATP